MLRFVARSVAVLVVSALIGSLAVFGLLRTLGGDAANVILGQYATPEAVEELREELGLNDPWHVQYGNWIGGLATGDLGESYAAKFDIYDQIVTRMGPTLLLTFGAFLVSVPISLTLGIYSAINADRRRGVMVDVGAQVGVAVPQFLAGLFLVLIFAVSLGWLPANGYVPFSEDPGESIRYLILPVIALSLSMTSVFTRYVRSAMLDVINSDYIRTAISKGQTMRRAIRVHGIRNASIPLVTVGTLQLGLMIAGSVVIENVFVVSGMGRLLLVAVQGREVIVVQSVVFILLLIILTLNFLMDIAYGFLDPRIRANPSGVTNG